MIYWAPLWTKICHDIYPIVIIFSLPVILLWFCACEKNVFSCACKKECNFFNALNKWNFYSCEHAAEGLSFGNSVYWICFDEEYAQKVNICTLMIYQHICYCVIIQLQWGVEPIILNAFIYVFLGSEIQVF